MVRMRARRRIGHHPWSMVIRAAHLASWRLVVPVGTRIMACSRRVHQHRTLRVHGMRMRRVRLRHDGAHQRHPIRSAILHAVGRVLRVALHVGRRRRVHPAWRWVWHQLSAIRRYRWAHRRSRRTRYRHPHRRRIRRGAVHHHGSRNRAGSHGHGVHHGRTWRAEQRRRVGRVHSWASTCMLRRRHRMGGLARKLARRRRHRYGRGGCGRSTMQSGARRSRRWHSLERSRDIVLRHP